MYNFGTGKWVFIDWLGIEPGYGTPWVVVKTNEKMNFDRGCLCPSGIELNFHQAQIDPTPVIIADKPWESKMLGFYASFIEDDGMLRCWYSPAGNGFHGLCYAESDNGVDWRKPDLGLVEFNGSKNNNCLAISAHGHDIFKDPSAPANERYKMVSCYWSGDSRNVIGAVSPDGLNWTNLETPVLSDQHADTKNVCTYNPYKKKYVLYTRQHGSSSQRRGVNRSETCDFRNFTPSEPVFENNPMDPPDWDIYCPGYSMWPGTDSAHVLRLTYYRHLSDTMQIHLATSRNETIWHRPLGGTSWLQEFKPYYPSTYAADGILPTGNGEWSTYVCSNPTAHNQPLPDNPEDKGALYRVPMREDGFSSLSAEGFGEFWTIPFTLNSDTISLNAKTGFGGYIRYELLETECCDPGKALAATTPIDGYKLEDCVEICGDHSNAELVWKNDRKLSELKGKDVRIHFQLFKTDLYSITF